MNLGKKFAITNVTLSSIILLLSPIFLVWFFDRDIHDMSYYSGGFQFGLFIYLIILIAGIIMGILTLCLVKDYKTKNRGLHIANGIIMILWIVLPVFTFIASIVISAILINQENNIKE